MTLICEVIFMVNKARIVANCPDCQSTISLPPEPELWMRITCPECGTQLEIVGDNPWELDYAEDFEDDELPGTEPDDSFNDYDTYDDVDER
jgi:lysine biosynthesis protein LysW